MSQQQAQACIEKMKADEAFRTKVMAVADVAERVKLINAEGFNCTAEELKVESQKLSDDDLNEVAGAGCTGVFCSVLWI